MATTYTPAHLIAVEFESGTVDINTRRFTFVDENKRAFTIVLSAEMEHKLWLELKPPFVEPPQTGFNWK